MDRTRLMEQNLVAHEQTSIDEALQMITDNQRGAVVVVDDQFVYGGIVSDGEIRRALVHGATQLAPLMKIVNRNAQTLPLQEKSEAEGLFAAHPEITLIPILGKGNVLVDVCIRDRGRRKD